MADFRENEKTFLLKTNHFYRLNNVDLLGKIICRLLRAMITNYFYF